MDLKKNQYQIKKKKKATINSLKDHVLLKNQKIGLAVSGGVDSMVMLDIFRKISKQNKLDIYVLHFNHKWRSESFKDAETVKKYCRKHKLNFIYNEAKDTIKRNEESARNDRYLFFKEAAKCYGLKTICTAHHKDDQVETILFRLARGTGLYGVLPIKEFQKFNNEFELYRPMLEISKNAVIKYAKLKKIPFVEDVTNLDVRYKRNLIRNKIIPLLQEINPNVSENINSFARLLYLQGLFCQKELKRTLKRISLSSSYRWNRKKFLGLDENIQYLFIYWFMTWNKIRGNLSKLDEIIHAINSFKYMDLGKNFRLEVDAEQIVFRAKKKQVYVRKPFNVDFKVEFKKSKFIKIGNTKYFVIEPFNRRKFRNRFPKDNMMKAYVDLSDFTYKTLTVRNRNSKDCFKPLGLKYVVKLKKYLIDKKIPKERRDKLLMLCRGKEVLWLPGYSLSDRIKVQAKPTHVVRILEK